MNSSGPPSPTRDPGTSLQPLGPPSAASEGQVGGSRQAVAADLPDPAEFKSVLIVKPSSLGDIIHALPTVALLAKSFPHLRLRWLVRPEFAPLLRGLPMVDELLLFPRADFRGPLGGCRAVKWALQLRRERGQGPELILDLQGLLRSSLISRVRARSGRGDVTVGLSDAREGARWFHQCRIQVDAAAHAVRRQLMAARALGVVVPDDEFDLPWPLPESSLPDWWPHHPGADGGNYVVLHPYSRGHGKALDAESIRGLIDALGGVPVVVVGQRSGAPEFVPSERVLDAGNRTSLPELVAILRGAMGVISVDSGPAHLAAAACGGPVISIHSRADPRQVGPWRGDVLAWFRGALAPMKRWLDPSGQVDGGGENRLPSIDELRQMAAALIK